MEELLIWMLPAIPLSYLIVVVVSILAMNQKPDASMTPWTGVTGPTCHIDRM